MAVELLLITPATIADDYVGAFASLLMVTPCKSIESREAAVAAKSS